MQFRAHIRSQKPTEIDRTSVRGKPRSASRPAAYYGPDNQQPDWTVNNQEDVNGEKLTVKKWRIFGADFSRFTQSFSRFIRDINGEKKNLVIDDRFFTVSFSRFAPSRDKFCR